MLQVITFKANALIKIVKYYLIAPDSAKRSVNVRPIDTSFVIS